MTTQRSYGHNIIVHGLSNGRSGIGIFVSRLTPLVLISSNLLAEFKNDKGVRYERNDKPYGKKYRNSFLGKSK